MTTLTRAERILYHQIHPLKLLTDITTSFASCWLLWNEDWALAAIVGFLPSFAVTGILLARPARLEQLRDTPFGRYVKINMSKRVTAIRIVGQLLMWAGAIVHLPWLVPAGFVIVVFAWLVGLWTPSPAIA